jgi:MFS family permease
MLNIIRAYLSEFKSFNGNARLLLLLSVFQVLGHSMFMLVLNLHVLALGYSRDFLGTIGALPPLCVALLAIPLAALCSGVPARNMLLASMALQAAAIAGVAALSSSQALLLCAAAMGASSAFFIITSFPLMARNSTSESRQHLFSFQFSVALAAAFAGSLTAGWLTRLWATSLFSGAEGPPAYRLTMICACAVSAAGILPAMRIREPQQARTRLAGFFKGINMRAALLVLAPQITISFGAGMIMPYLNIFFKGTFGLAILRLGSLMALMPLAMSAGGLIGPWMVRRLGRVRAMVTLQSLSIPFLATMGFSGLLLPTVIAAFGRTMLMNASWPVYSVFMLSHFPEAQHSAASAMYSSLWNLTFSAGARLSGRLQTDFGFTLPFLITIVAYSLATLMLSKRFLREDTDPKTVPPEPIKEELE